MKWRVKKTSHVDSGRLPGDHLWYDVADPDDWQTIAWCRQKRSEADTAEWELPNVTAADQPLVLKPIPPRPVGYRGADANPWAGPEAREWL